MGGAEGQTKALAPVAQTISEEVFQVGDGVNLLDRGINIVLDSAVANRLAVEEDVAGAPIPVARLAHRTDIAEGLATVQVIDVLNFFRAVEFQAFREDAGHVRVTLKAITIHEREDALHLTL